MALTRMRSKAAQAVIDLRQTLAAFADDAELDSYTVTVYGLAGRKLHADPACRNVPEVPERFTLTLRGLAAEPDRIATCCGSSIHANFYSALRPYTAAREHYQALFWAPLDQYPEDRRGSAVGARLATLDDIATFLTEQALRADSFADLAALADDRHAELADHLTRVDQSPYLADFRAAHAEAAFDTAIEARFGAAPVKFLERRTSSYGPNSGAWRQWQGRIRAQWLEAVTADTYDPAELAARGDELLRAGSGVYGPARIDRLDDTRAFTDGARFSSPEAWVEAEAAELARRITRAVIDTLDHYRTAAADAIEGRDGDVDGDEDLVTVLAHANEFKDGRNDRAATTMRWVWACHDTRYVDAGEDRWLLATVPRWVHTLSARFLAFRRTPYLRDGACAPDLGTLAGLLAGGHDVTDAMELALRLGR